MKRTEYFRQYYHRRKARMTPEQKAQHRCAARFKARVTRLGWEPSKAFHTAPHGGKASPGYLKVNEACVRTLLSADAIRKAIVRGELRAARIQIGRKMYRYEIHEIDLRDWLAHRGRTDATV